MEAPFTAISRLWKQLWCNDCGESYVKGCPIHGGLTVIEDEYVPPRAIASLPSVLSVNQQDDSNAFSVYATTSISKGTRLGPVDGIRQPVHNKSSLFDKWVVFNAEGPPFSIQQQSLTTSNWTAFLSQSKDRNLCNLVVFQHLEDLYLVTSRNVQPRERLAFEYSQSYKTCLKLAMAVPTLQKQIPADSSMEMDHDADNQSVNKILKGEDALTMKKKEESTLRESLVVQFSAHINQCTKENSKRLCNRNIKKGDILQKQVQLGKVGEAQKTNSPRSGKLRKQVQNVGYKGDNLDSKEEHGNNTENQDCFLKKTIERNFDREVKQIKHLENDDRDIESETDFNLEKEDNQVQDMKPTQKTERSPRKRKFQIDGATKREVGSVPSFRTRHKFSELMNSVQEVTKITVPEEELRAMADDLLNRLIQVPDITKDPAAPNHNPSRHKGLIGWHLNIQAPHYKHKEIYTKSFEGVEFQTKYKMNGKGVYEIQMEIICNNPNDAASNLLLFGETKKPKTESKAAYSKMLNSRNIDLYETHLKKYCIKAIDHKSSVIARDAKHVRIHDFKIEPGIENDIMYICFICDPIRWYQDCKYYRRHTKFHFHDVICEHCGEKFKRNHCLKKHVEAHHTKDRPRNHQCDHCTKAFRTPKELKQHMKFIHDPNKDCPLCPECGKTFSSKGILKRHLLTHLNIQPYECDICTRKFSQKSDLKIHKERIHVHGSTRLQPAKYLEIAKKRLSQVNPNLESNASCQIRPSTQVDTSVRNTCNLKNDTTVRCIDILSKDTTVSHMDGPLNSISVDHMVEISNDTVREHIENFSNDTSGIQIDNLPYDTLVIQVDSLPNDTSVEHIHSLDT